MNYLIIVSTVNCFLEYLAPIVIKFLMIRLYTSSKSDLLLHTDLLDLKQEMASISMVDEFSKYARLQRKYIKLESELKNKTNAQMSSRMKAKLTVTYAFKIFNALVTLVLLYLYNSEPVIILPKNALWPFQGFFKWPCHHEDAISLAVWVIIVRLVVAICKQKDES